MGKLVSLLKDGLPGRAALLLAAIAVFCVAARPVAAEDFIVAVNNAPPYRIIDSTSGTKKYTGIYVDFVRELASRAGISIKFRDTLFRRALQYMEAGRADIMAGPNRTPEREVFMVYLDEELSRERKAFYVRAGGPSITVYDDLKSLRVGVLRDSVYFDQFDNDDALNKFESTDYSTALELLETDRVDTVIMPELLGDYMAKLSDAQVERSAFSAGGKPSFIAISRLSPLADRVDELTQIIREMKDDGTVDAIISRYRPE